MVNILASGRPILIVVVNCLLIIVNSYTDLATHILAVTFVVGIFQIISRMVKVFLVKNVIKV